MLVERHRIDAASATLAAIVTGALFAGFAGLGVGVRSPTSAEQPLKVFDLAAPQGSAAVEPEPAAPPAPPPVSAVFAVAPAPATLPPALPVMSPPAATGAATSSLPADTAPTTLTTPHPVAAPAPSDGAEASVAPRGAADGVITDNAGASRAYAARIRAWLLAHRVYPRRARMRRIEGSVRVRFTLDRTGRLLDGAVIQPSGEASLDQEGVAMLDRSSPYPAAPPEVQGDRIVMTADIDFMLKH